MAELASFWAGEALGPIELACARSFLRHGDRITVYSPRRIDNLPLGAEGRDAAEILPGERIARHRRTASPALHSDLFRYALLAKTEAVWVDLDILALRPFEFGSPWVVAWESHRHVNGAVLRLPRDSATLRALLTFGPDTVGFPPHLQGAERLWLWLRTGGRGAPIDRWVWGSAGPKALTHFLRATGEIAHALPVQAFYSVPHEDAGDFLEPGGLDPAELPADAWGVHLWASSLRRLIRDQWGGRIPPDSFLGRAVAQP